MPAPVTPLTAMVNGRGQMRPSSSARSRAALIRLCQPLPPARKWAMIAGSSRIETGVSLTAFFGRPARRVAFASAMAVKNSGGRTSRAGRAAAKSYAALLKLVEPNLVKMVSAMSWLETGPVNQRTDYTRALNEETRETILRVLKAIHDNLTTFGKDTHDE